MGQDGILAMKGSERRDMAAYIDTCIVHVRPSALTVYIFDF